jgi:hypothetical protein
MLVLAMEMPPMIMQMHAGEISLCNGRSRFLGLAATEFVRR